jgi:hypothetical protein
MLAIIGSKPIAGVKVAKTTRWEALFPHERAINPAPCIGLIRPA